MNKVAHTISWQKFNSDTVSTRVVPIDLEIMRLELIADPDIEHIWIRNSDGEILWECAK